jgi:hypothetical protein
MGIELSDLIHVYPDAIEHQVCDYLIDFYENNLEHQKKIENKKLPNLTELNLTENLELDDTINDIHNYFIEITIKYRDLYYEYVDRRCFPEDHAFEQFKIDRYSADTEDEYATHVDILDYPSAKRFLSFSWYLNDIETGGKTIFRDLQITPKKGTLLISPPLWMYPYKEERPISGSKYILSTYLHYM